MGLKRVVRNVRTIAFSEIEKFACEILAARMAGGQIDPAPIWTNLKTFPCEQFRGMVDCLIAGYPCQPFSHAGNRQGEEDPRHLWPHIQRAVGIIRPRLLFMENVAGHVTLGLKNVLHDICELGYEVTAGLFEARAEGLPHKRQRLFILAYDKSAGIHDSIVWQTDFARNGKAGSQQFNQAHGQDLAPAPPGAEQFWWEPARVLGNDNSGRFKECSQQDGEKEAFKQAPQGNDTSGRNKVLANATKQRMEGRGAGGEQVTHSHAGQEIFVCKGITGTTELGNATGERPRGRGEDCIGKQSEMLGQGLEQTKLADPARNSEQGCEHRQGKKQFRGSGTARHRHEIIATMGGNFNGVASGVVESGLLAAYQSLGSGCHSRTDELRAAGNGVIPACAATAFVTLFKELSQ